MKNRRAILFLILACVCGGGAAFTAQQLLENQQPEVVEQRFETTSVAVATQPINAASEIVGEFVEVVDWPEDHVPEGYFATSEDVAGRVAKRALTIGEPILESALLPIGAQAGLASIIDDKHRAVSVKVDPIVGVAGFVTPGSTVDVLVTVRRVDWTNQAPYAKTVLQNVKVLAIDQKTEEAKNGDPELVSVVTLEVDPQQAEKLTYMAHEGQLQLALRNPKDHEVAKTPGVTVASLVGGNVKRRAATTVQVLKGTDVSSSRF